MAEEAGHREVSTPPPCPWLMVSDEDENLTLHSPTGEQLQIVIPPELPQEIEHCCYGWLILIHKGVEHKKHDEHWFSLWNPLTDDRIHLPAFSIEPQQEESSSCDCRCILSSPPGNDDCMVIVIETKTPCFVFCRIGDKQWTVQPMPIDSEKYFSGLGFPFSPVICNGRLYFHTMNYDSRELFVFDIKSDHLELSIAGMEIPWGERASVKRIDLVESFGEIYAINQGRKGVYGCPDLQRVISLELYKLDLPRKEWIKVESFKDSVFFVSLDDNSLSCPAVGLEGNHVHYDTIYSFNMEDKTISISSPHSKIKIQKSEYVHIRSFYIMPDTDSMSSYVERQISGSPKIKPEILRDTGSHKEEVAEAEFAYFGKLPSDVQSMIAKCLGLHDYMSFRVANKMCRLAAPPIRSSLPPLVTYDSLCNFIDPTCCKKYPIIIPNNEMKDVIMCYSSDGWCVMLQGEDSIFLWNPFTNKTIMLPKLPHKCRAITACGFSTSPNSSDCVIVLLCDVELTIYIDFICLKDKQWKSIYASSFGRDRKICYDNNLSFYDGNFYFLTKHGKLGAVYLNGEGSASAHVREFKLPFSWPLFHHIFLCLLECDGKLLSVSVDSFGKWVRVFRLLDSKNRWKEVRDLGNHTLYISRLSSFSKPATLGMKNRVYLPRYYGKSVVYYSLDSRKFHCHGSEDILEDLDATKEQFFCGWVETKY
ncbi:hypothetical protein SLE2022_245440 [Rubroshorea leprosula]